MKPLDNLPPSCLAFSDLYPGSTDLTEQTYQINSSKEKTTYHGMPVQRLDIPFPVYHSQFYIHQDNADPVNLINKHNIALQVPADSAHYFGTDILDISHSIPAEYEICNSGNVARNDAPPSIPDIPFSGQVCLSGGKPETGEPTSAGHLDPADQSTNIPAPSTNPQDLPPVTSVNPLNLNQTASDNPTSQAEKIAEDNASKAGGKRKRRLNVAAAERKKRRDRERYKNNPVYAERERVRNRERYRNDPVYAARLRELEKKRRRMRREDPVYAECLKEQRKNPAYPKSECCRNNPAYTERHRQHQRELRKDPVYLERERALHRERQRERRKDPVYVEREKQRRKERQNARKSMLADIRTKKTQL